MYGADFRTTFAGNPESEYAYGCYAPCIVTTANNFLSDKDYEGKAFDISSTDFETLLHEYIDYDIPVVIWITYYLHEVELTTVWTTPDGYDVQWKAYEHCVVLTGYDLDKKLVYVSDPLAGSTSYDYETLKQRYIDMGEQAVHIKTYRQKYGDIDHDEKITSNDALSALRMSADIDPYNPEDILPFADIDSDESITSADALEILRYSVGITDESSAVGKIFNLTGKKGL